MTAILIIILTTNLLNAAQTTIFDHDYMTDEINIIIMMCPYHNLMLMMIWIICDILYGLIRAFSKKTSVATLRPERSDWDNFPLAFSLLGKVTQ